AGVSDYNEWKGERAPKLRRPTVPRTTGGRAAFLRDSLRPGEAFTPVAGRPACRRNLPNGQVLCQARDLSHGDHASPRVSQPTRQCGEISNATRWRNALLSSSSPAATTPSSATTLLS